jgi:hypothetical protein
MAGHSTFACWPPAPPRAETEYCTGMGGYPQATLSMLGAIA